MNSVGSVKHSLLSFWSSFPDPSWSCSDWVCLCEWVSEWVNVCVCDNHINVLSLSPTLQPFYALSNSLWNPKELVRAWLTLLVAIPLPPAHPPPLISVTFRLSPRFILSCVLIQSSVHYNYHPVNTIGSSSHSCTVVHSVFRDVHKFNILSFSAILLFNPTEITKEILPQTNLHCFNFANHFVSFVTIIYISKRESVWRDFVGCRWSRWLASFLFFFFFYAIINIGGPRFTTVTTFMEKNRHVCQNAASTQSLMHTNCRGHHYGTYSCEKHLGHK